MDWESRIPRRGQEGRGEGRLVMGLVIVAMGVLFLLDNLGLVYVRNVWGFFWPAILIALGLARLSTCYSPAGRVSGIVLVCVGGLLLVNKLGIIPVDVWHLFWPVILILWGVAMLFRGLQRGDGGGSGWSGGWNPNWDPARWRAQMAARGFGPYGDTSPNTVHQWAFFGGSRRRIDSQNFEGGDALAIFGGIRVDLRQAASTKDEIHLEANALFGGVDIRVPESWNVIMRGMGVFGGFEDGTRGRENGFPSGKPTLIVTGMAMFGGVTVKN
jgi:predicted membrane protein